MQRQKKGFTLIEMLVVIAIVAILVVMVIPTVQTSAKKSNAAADAANLRSVLGEANVVVFDGTRNPQESADYVKIEGVKCKSFKNAKLYLVYTLPGFIDVYFVDGSSYYGLDYFSELAATGETEQSVTKPVFPESYKEQWFNLSDG